MIATGGGMRYITVVSTPFHSLELLAYSTAADIHEEIYVLGPGE